MTVNKTFLISSGIGAAVLLVMAPWASSQPPAGPGGVGGASGGAGRGRGPAAFDYSDNEGWTSLFDGNTLNGWEGDTRFWKIKDGTIYIQSTCEQPTGTIYLVWQGGQPSDFELKFDFKGTGNINGGMQYRSYLTADTTVEMKYPTRAGRGGRGASGAALVVGGGGGGRGGSGGGGGRGPACANPGVAPTDVRDKYNMSGPQFDFDAGNRYPGQYYEQGARGIVASPGQAVIAEAGKPVRLLSTLADRATLDSWFHKDDWNQFMVIAKGNTHSMYMNGHLVSVFIDNDPNYFRANGRIGIEVESTGELFTRNIYMKRM